MSSQPTYCSKADWVVVDTGPLLKGYGLDRLANKLYSVPEVVKEIRDQKSRQLLENVALTIKSPSEEALHAVIRFSKLTGDFASLSMTDLKVLALAYALEKERNGVAHIKTTPEKLTTASINGKMPILYMSGERVESVALASMADESDDDNDDDDQIDEEEIAAKIAQMDLAATENTPAAQQNGTTLTPDESTAQESPIAPEVEQPQQKDDDVEEEDSDGGEWITPDNVESIKAREYGLDAGAQTVARTVDVACMSTDFAMQNVLLQMGLNLMSMDGMLIKQVKTWVLRCHACFKVTTEMDRQFCPSCGGNTLTRASASTDKDGNLCIFLSKKFNFNTRGTRYSIPKQQTGKHANNLILREDERAYQVAVHRNRRKAHQDWSDPDYIPALLQGESGRLAKNSLPAIGHGRRNPNASRRGGKSKKRDR